jgi:hypothetical protein
VKAELKKLRNRLFAGANRTRDGHPDEHLLTVRPDVAVYTIRGTDVEVLRIYDLHQVEGPLSPCGRL